MTFTWDSTTITTDLAKVRHMIGDTESTDPYLTDEQIAYELTQTASLILAAANCCQRVLAKLARKIDRSGAQFQATRSQLFQHYTDLEIKLRAQASTVVKPFFGGTSIDDRSSIEDDDDYVPAAFNRGDFDNGDDNQGGCNNE